MFLLQNLFFVWVNFRFKCITFMIKLIIFEFPSGEISKVFDLNSYTGITTMTSMDPYLWVFVYDLVPVQFIRDWVTGLGI